MKTSIFRRTRHTIPRRLRAGGPTSLLVLIASTVFGHPASASIIGSDVFVNEFHYDNSGADANEFIELVIPDVHAALRTRMRVTLYNGSRGRLYGAVVSVSSFEHDPSRDESGVGFYYYDDFASLQNGAPDGFALAADVDDDGIFEQVQLLSYEGSFVASNGDAAGMTSIDVGVSEPSNTPRGFSLQLGGNGKQYGDFAWQSAGVHTKGGVNGGQSFANSSAVPEPAGVVIWMALLGAVCLARRRKLIRAVDPG